MTDWLVGNTDPEFKKAVIDWVAIGIYLLITAIAAAATYFLMSPAGGKQKGPDAAGLKDFSLPTADEGRVVPELYGRRQIFPNLLWYGDFRAKSIKVKAGSGKNGQKIKVGYAYFLGMLWGLAGRVDKLLELRMGEDVQAASEDGLAASFTAMTGTPSEVNGSNTGKSMLRWLDGSQTAADPCIETQTSAPIAYKGISLLVMQQAFVGDNTTMVPQYSVVARRCPNVVNPGASNPADRHVVGEHDANPVDVIHDILTRLSGVAPDLLDLPSFQTAQLTLANEGLGLSFTMNEARAAGDWIDDICRHVDAVLFFDDRIGRFKMRLIRDDYDAPTLPTLTESDYANLHFKRRAWEDVMTDLTIQWMSPRTWKEKTHRIVNPAARRVLGYVKSETINFPMFTSDEAVARAAAMMKRRYFYPLASMTFDVSPGVFDPMPGDVARLSCARLGFAGMVIRVMAVDRSDSRSEEITVEAVEDVWGLGQIAVEPIQGSGADPMIWTLNDPPRFLTVKDALAEIAPEGKAILAIAAPPASGTAIGMKVFAGETDVGQLSLAGTGTLLSAYGAGDQVDRSAEGFVVEDGIGLTATINSEGAWQRCATPVVLDSRGAAWELASVKTIEDLGDGRFRFTGLIRGIAGTPILAHPAGARVWVLPESIFEVSALDVSDEALNAPLTIAARAFNARGQSPDAVTNHTYGWRAETPYPPSNVRATRDGDAITISWAACRRHAGAHNVNADTFPAFEDTPEGQWLVTWTVGQTARQAVVDAPEFQNSDGAPRAYTVRSLLAGRLSAGAQITI